MNPSTYTPVANTQACYVHGVDRNSMNSSSSALSLGKSNVRAGHGPFACPFDHSLDHCTCLVGKNTVLCIACMLSTCMYSRSHSNDVICHYFPTGHVECELDGSICPLDPMEHWAYSVGKHSILLSHIELIESIGAIRHYFSTGQLKCLLDIFLPIFGQ